MHWALRIKTFRCSILNLFLRLWFLLIKKNLQTPPRLSRQQLPPQRCRRPLQSAAMQTPRSKDS
jgi:hypothetical protein